MPKDYAKRPKNSKQQSKSRRHSKKTASPQAKPLTKQQLARQKASPSFNFRCWHRRRFNQFARGKLRVDSL